MKAIAITQAAADGDNIPFLTEIDLPVPSAHGRDLLVAVKAVSVNPVDTKVRAGFQGDTNCVTYVSKQGMEAMPMMSKTAVAEDLIRRCAVLLKEREAATAC